MTSCVDRPLFSSEKSLRSCWRRSIWSFSSSSCSDCDLVISANTFSCSIFFFNCSLMSSICLACVDFICESSVFADSSNFSFNASISLLDCLSVDKRISSISISSFSVFDSKEDWLFVLISITCVIFWISSSRERMAECDYVEQSSSVGASIENKINVVYLPRSAFVADSVTSFSNLFM